MRPVHRSLVWETVERVGGGEADRAAATRHFHPAPEPEPAGSRYSHLRKASPATVLLPMSRRWLEGLPSGAYPQRLAEDFPRLVNLIALEWRDPMAATRLLSEFLVDTRHGRRGFPSAIRHELRQLADLSLRRTMS
jgi:hypothetical protein